MHLTPDDRAKIMNIILDLPTRYGLGLINVFAEIERREVEAQTMAEISEKKAALQQKSEERTSTVATPQMAGHAANGHAGPPPASAPTE